MELGMVVHTYIPARGLEAGQEKLMSSRPASAV